VLGNCQIQGVGIIEYVVHIHSKFRDQSVGESFEIIYQRRQAAIRNLYVRE